jgi:hypothetical protein
MEYRYEDRSSGEHLSDDQPFIRRGIEALEKLGRNVKRFASRV